MIGNKIGKLGEDIAELFLKKHGFNVFTRNYLKKYGEIDLIAERDGITHFIEVKSVSHEKSAYEVTRESDLMRPEENLHKNKLKKLSRVTESYLLSHTEVRNWVFDLCVIYIDIHTKKAEVKFVEDIPLPE